VRRFCRRHARANALIWMPSGWACCSARSRRRVADGALAPPVAPSGQENERYWRLAGRRSRARCGRSYARPHDHLRRAQQGADLPDDGRLDVACGHAPDRARVVAQLQGRSRAVKPIKSAPSGIWWLVQSRQWLLTRYTSMCCGPPALLAHAHSRSASQPGSFLHATAQNSYIDEAGVRSTSIALSEHLSLREARATMKRSRSPDSVV